MTMAERIAVTGVGIVSALGPDSRSTFSHLCDGTRGFGPVTLFDVAEQRVQFAAEVRGLRVSDVAPAGQAESWSRTDALAVLAANEALRSSGVGAKTSGLALSIGGTTGGMYEAESVLLTVGGAAATPEASARRLLSYPLSTTAERIAERVAGVTRAITICSACSSGAVALVQAAAWLLAGRADVVLAGGTDGLCQLTFTGFNSLGAMDAEPCRPFDEQRAGLSLGEGAGFLVLELESHAKKRGARVLSWFSGWSVLSEAHHITHPEPTGSVAAQILSRALERAGRAPSDVDYVNAHGTGTAHNDAMESQALLRALGAERERVVVSSAKGQIGHTLGAAGGIEAALTVLAIEAGRAPATGGLTRPDPALGLRHAAAPAERLDIRCALSNSFGFGGTGCVLVFEREDRKAAHAASKVFSELAIVGLATAGPAGLLEGVDNAVYARSEARTLEPSPAKPLDWLEPARSRRFDAGSALVTAGAERALRDAGLEPDHTGLVAGTAYGNVERSVAFLKRVHERGPRLASPAEFPHLVPSAASGNASIYLGLRGPVVSVSDLASSAEAACDLAMSFISAGLAERVVAGSAEPFDPIVARVLSPIHLSGSAAPRAAGAGFVVLESLAAARARGARIYARVGAWIGGWASARQSFAQLAVGPDGSASAVLLGETEAELLLALDQSPWRDVPRTNLSDEVGEHEALGGVALAAGAARLFRDRLGSVLVCSQTRGRCYLALLEPALDGSAP